MYVICGATGNVGSKIVQILLAENEQVGAISRSADNLQPLVDQGATPLVGDLFDAEFLTSAFAGATAVFTIVPPVFQTENMRADQNRATEAIATALERSGVTHVVNLSSLGADQSEGGGVVDGLHDQEERLNQIAGLNLVNLRSTYFMESNMGYIGMIKHQGIVGSPLAGDLKVHYIHTQDVAQAAADLLLKRDFTGKSVKNILGGASLTMNEMTAILGEAVGKPGIPYIQFSPEDARQGMIGMGLPPAVAESYVQFNVAINEGRAVVNVARTPENTTDTPFSVFVQQFAYVYQMQD